MFINFRPAELILGTLQSIQLNLKLQLRYSHSKVYCDSMWWLLDITFVFSMQGTKCDLKWQNEPHSLFCGVELFSNDDFRHVSMTAKAWTKQVLESAEAPRNKIGNTKVRSKMLLTSLIVTYRCECVRTATITLCK